MSDDLLGVVFCAAMLVFCIAFWLVPCATFAGPAFSQSKKLAADVKPPGLRRRPHWSDQMIATACPEIEARIKAEQRRLSQPRYYERLTNPLSEGVATLEEYGLDVRLINALECAGYLWLSDLVDVDADTIAAIPNIGQRSVGKIARSLRLFVAVQADLSRSKV